jgi:hypothetical protein
MINTITQTKTELYTKCFDLPNPFDRPQYSSNWQLSHHDEPSIASMLFDFGYFDPGSYNNSTLVYFQEHMKLLIKKQMKIEIFSMCV